MHDHTELWRHAMQENIASYRRMIDAAVAQLPDSELHQRPADGMNSVAVLLRHLGGNLRSRWTDFLTTDGEKPERDRDAEFTDWDGNRESLLEEFDAGWTCLTAALDEFTAEDLFVPIFIRGEEHTLPQACMRTLAHIAHHAGQIVMIARMVHVGEWNWLTIPPGQSAEHNHRTWGTAASRSVQGGGSPAPSRRARTTDDTSD